MGMISQVVFLFFFLFFSACIEITTTSRCAYSKYVLYVCIAVGSRPCIMTLFLVTVTPVLFENKLARVGLGYSCVYSYTYTIISLYILYIHIDIDGVPQYSPDAS